MPWMIDPVHTQIEFSARHLGISTVKGQFRRFTGTLQFDPENITASMVEVSIDSASIDTGNQKRDDDLREERFLNVEKFPAITFKSVNLDAAGGDDYRLKGELTICGVTRPVTLKVTYWGESKDLYSNLKAGISAEARINRKDFGLMWNQVVETGGLIVGEQVKISIESEIKQVAAAAGA